MANERRLEAVGSGFCSREPRQDEETDLTYLHARYYDPGLGVFLSPDPARASLNAYAYASGDPINASDRSGLDDCGGGCIFQDYEEPDRIEIIVNVGTDSSGHTVATVVGVAGAGGLSIGALWDWFGKRLIRACADSPGTSTGAFPPPRTSACTGT